MWVQTVLAFAVASMLGTQVMTAEPSTNPSPMDNLEAAVDEAITSLTRRYEDMRKASEEAVNSNIIPNAIADLSEKVSAANQTIIGLGAQMFEMIEEVETVGGHSHCLVGVKDQAQRVVDDGSRNLEGCDFPLRFLREQFNDSINEWMSGLDIVALQSRKDILSCVPTESDPSEVVINIALQCVQNETMKAVRLFDTSQEQLVAILNETRRQLEDAGYQAERRVEVAQRVAYDQTGYLMSTLSNCVTDGDPSTTTGTTTVV